MLLLVVLVGEPEAGPLTGSGSRPAGSRAAGRWHPPSGTPIMMAARAPAAWGPDCRI